MLFSRGGLRVRNDLCLSMVMIEGYGREEGIWLLIADLLLNTMGAMKRGEGKD